MFFDCVLNVVIFSFCVVTLVLSCILCAVCVKELVDVHLRGVRGPGHTLALVAGVLLAVR